MILYTDGGCKPSSGAYGSFRIESDDGTLWEICRWAQFNYPVNTNNQAEYAILFEALLYTQRYKPSKLDIYTDSQLMVKQLKKEYEIKDQSLALWASKVWAEIAYHEEQGTKVTITHVPRTIIVGKLGH